MKGFGKKIGSFVSGSLVKLLLRKKSDEEFELGQLFVAGTDPSNYTLYQIKDLAFGSQIPESALELMAGYELERESANLKIYEPELRNYVLASARPLITIKNKRKLSLPKKLPKFFGDIIEITDDHLDFFEVPDDPIILGKIRSGSKVMNTKVKINGPEVLRHHILIPATTGRGKSNLVKVILFNLMENEKIGKLVFDPHNEYYGTPKQMGLKDHPKGNDFIEYYTVRTITGSLDLKFNVNLLNPWQVMGSVSLTNAQKDALILYFREYGNEWIQALFDEEKSVQGVAPQTQSVLTRKLSILLNFSFDEDNDIIENGIYTLSGYESTVENIMDSLKEGKTVIVDTSLFSGNEEIFVATIIVERIFNKYKSLKYKDELEKMPVITVILEEAPRVIGKKVLDVQDNIFGQIAREGRKFKIGLIGITQLPSLIEREILANMNTKIILGNEMGPERQTLIDSSAQDLSDDSQTIASLDIGEAIITSNFTKFAIPIKIPLFDDLIKQKSEKKEDKKPKRGIAGL
ncbi:MAG: putative ATPase [Promethearchaeota archaeon]|nr:MAG: putative ATPase [Candidatus Lokiarchaeota archaeon]